MRFLGAGTFEHFGSAWRVEVADVGKFMVHHDKLIELESTFVKNLPKLQTIANHRMSIQRHRQIFEIGDLHRENCEISDMCDLSCDIGEVQIIVCSDRQDQKQAHMTQHNQ